MNREAIQAEIRAADQLAAKLQESRSSDDDLRGAKVALEQIRTIVSDHWPLTAAERSKVNIGLYAIRVLEGGPYGKLPDMLMTLDYHLKHD